MKVVGIWLALLPWLGLCFACQGQVSKQSVCGSRAKLTALEPGAVLFPSNIEPLGLPFPTGYKIQIRSGYGPNAGSQLHTGIDLTYKGNDYYALDLQYANESNGGLGKPVIAPLDGIVALSGWATGGWSNFGRRVVLRHNLEDGHYYHSLYAHLKSIDDKITVGATVKKGQLLGELGQSCQNQDACSSFDWPHLHFSIHQDSNIGGTGTGSSYAGLAVLPEPLDKAEDLERWDTLFSQTEAVDCAREDCIAPDPCADNPDAGLCLPAPPKPAPIVDQDSTAEAEANEECL
ncbi:MAG: M23 family metallopeptidase [Myxococcales bacterium]|nr:MAG: M23 family metallopeptidase [Myxococcales bacterium]